MIGNRSGGKCWRLFEVLPKDYRSCVSYEVIGGLLIRKFFQHQGIGYGEGFKFVMLRGGTTRFVRSWLVMFVELCHFPSLRIGEPRWEGKSADPRE